MAVAATGLEVDVFWGKDGVLIKDVGVLLEHATKKITKHKLNKVKIFFDILKPFPRNTSSVKAIIEQFAA